MGGAEIQVSHLARKFRSRGWKVTVVSMTPPEALVEILESEGVVVESLEMKAGFPDPRAISRLASIIKKTKPSVVHSHMVHANILSRITKALSPSFKQILVSTAHNTVEGGKWVERAYRSTDRYCDLTTNVSQAAVDRYIKIGAAPAHRIRLVRNGLDTARFDWNEETRSKKRDELGLKDSFTWLAVGRLTEAKNYSLMLKAFKHFENQNIRLLIVGQGEDEDSLKKLSEELGLSEKITWLGRRSDVSELMAASDGYLMSSLWEGLPMVLLEASASALPVVATDVGGNKEIVQESKSGFIVPSSSENELVSAMNSVQNMSLEARLELGSFGRTFVRKTYELDLIVDQWESIFNNLKST